MCPTTGALNTFAFPDGGLDADWLPLSSAFTSASHMDPHLILHIFLPMLVFESSMSVRWTVFKTVVPQAALLATVGLVICSVLTALVAMYIFPYGWGWAAGLTLGAILSATDPVAVVALLKDLGASPRLATLIEGESLLNDGTAIVLFGVVLEALKGAPVEGSQVVVEFLRLAGGGALLGWVVSYCACWWLGKVFNDPLVEISITLLTAYTCFFVAESAHLSGVLAVSMGGLCVAVLRRAPDPCVLALPCVLSRGLSQLVCVHRLHARLRRRRAPSPPLLGVTYVCGQHARFLSHRHNHGGAHSVGAAEPRGPRATVAAVRAAARRARDGRVLPHADP